MKIDEIKTIVELMSQNDLTEFKIESDKENLCIKRGCQSFTSIVPQFAQQPAAVAAPAPVAPEKAKTIDSPIVGTFYRSGSPDASPFVKVGDKVDAETVVCIIEAMKVMNEVKAEKSGVIKDILLENGTPVEYGQALFVIE